MIKRQGIPARFRKAEELRRNTVNENTGPMNLLSLMFREIRNDLVITPLFWDTRLNQYLKDPRNQVVQTSRGRSTERSNLNRELARQEMTLHNFIRGMRVLRPINLKFMLLIEHRDKTRTSHVDEINEIDLYTEYHNAKYPHRLNILHRLFLDIKSKVIADEADWENRVNKYVNEPVNGFVERNRQSTERSNLNRGIKNPDMSIKVFTKAMKVIDPQCIYFTLELTFPDDRITLHEVRMDGRFLVTSEDDEDDDC